MMSLFLLLLFSISARTTVEMINMITSTPSNAKSHFRRDGGVEDSLEFL
jgi:hypothetical protein